MEAEDEIGTDLVVKNKSKSVIWRYSGFREEDVEQSVVLCRSASQKSQRTCKLAPQETTPPETRPPGNVTV